MHDVEAKRFANKPFEYFRNVLNAPQSIRVPQEVFGPTPPNLFVGRHNYPNVFVGPLVQFEEVQGAQENPDAWYGKSVQEIVGFRSSLLRGMQVSSVKAPARVVADVQDIIMSTRIVDVEVRLKKAITQSASFSTWHEPTGPSAQMEALRIAGNPRIPSKIAELAEEKVTVRESVGELLDAGTDYYYLQRLLSAGILGKQKKLVPTRWSITAADKILADSLLQEVKDAPEISQPMVFSNTYLHNHFEILLVPGKWEFEQFESWEPGATWDPGDDGLAHEYEPFEGRSDYAQTEGGGYYAGRMGVVEGLSDLRKQARCIVFREIGKGYDVPLGVWVVRETVRNAFKNKAETFDTLNAALAHVQTKLKRPLSQYSRKSIVLSQRKLHDF